MANTPKITKEFSVGEISSRSGLPISTIHFYEAKGLISSNRNKGNHRRYARSVLRKLAVIKVAQKTGVPLEDIKRAMNNIPNDKPVTAEDWDKLAEVWRQELDDRINQLIRLRDMLGSCIGCGCLSIDNCDLINPGDTISKKGPGAYYLDPKVDLSLEPK